MKELILRYQNGKYIYEEEITRKVFRESNRCKRILLYNAKPIP